MFLLSWIHQIFHFICDNLFSIYRMFQPSKIQLLLIFHPKTISCFMKLLPLKIHRKLIKYINMIHNKIKYCNKCTYKSNYNIFWYMCNKCIDIHIFFLSLATKKDLKFSSLVIYWIVFQFVYPFAINKNLNTWKFY